MPANLSPEYLEAEKQYKAAKTPDEKLSWLEEMLRVIPKHKGTEHMQGDIKRRVKNLRENMQKKSGGRRTSLYTVPKEGAGQVVLVGPPNSGKSALIVTLTNSEPEVAAYPYTTQLPTPAMMPWEDVHIQLVDGPPISKQWYEPWQGGIIRIADLVWFVIDASSDNLLSEYEIVLSVLEKHRIHLLPKPYKGHKEVGHAYVETVLVANKTDHEKSAGILSVFEEFYGGRFARFDVSAERGHGLEHLKNETFSRLRVIRVYTKAPGKDPIFAKPVTLPVGSTVFDFCFEIHKDFAKKLKHARIWGKKAKFDGQMVNRDHVLIDQDIVELRI